MTSAIIVVELAMLQLYMYWHHKFGGCDDYRSIRAMILNNYGLDQIRSDIHTQKHTRKPQESRPKIVPQYTISASLRGRKPHLCLHSSHTPLRGIPSPAGDRGQGRLPPRIGRGTEMAQARRADNSDLDRTREGAFRLITSLHDTFDTP